MYNFIKKRFDSNIKNREIEYIEKKYSILFPKELKEFYLRFDGCEIYFCEYTLYENKYDVSEFLPLIKSDYSVESKKDDELLDNYIPSNYIPFAINSGGDHYYWDSNEGKIYLVYSEQIESPIYICECIQEFFDIIEKGLIEYCNE